MNKSETRQVERLCQDGADRLEAKAAVCGEAQASPKPKARKVARSAGSGEFVSEGEAQANPSTTTIETVP